MESGSVRGRMSQLASGHNVEVLEGEELARQMRDWRGYKKGLVRLTPGPWVMPKGFLKFADKFYEFKFRPNDVLIMTYPKCGTTWTQEIVWTMRNNPDLTSPDANLRIFVKSPFLELDSLVVDYFDGDGGMMDDKNPFIQAFKKCCPGRNPADGVNWQLAECIKEPRTIKTHLPFSLVTPSLLDTCKVVYVARNPKDMVVSYHHHSRIINVHGFDGTLDDFVQYFVDDDLVYGTYAGHLKEAWEQRNHPNMHIIFFEDMKKDAVAELKRLNTFLGTKLTEKQLENVAQHTSFKAMKQREADLMGEGDGNNPLMHPERRAKDGGFFRKGETGDWKNKLTPALAAKVDAWTQKHMKNVGLDFKYSI